MYLQARAYVSGYEFNPKEEKDQYSRIVAEIGLPPDICPGVPSLTVAVTVAYWRKANAIHKWFVDNCQEGKDECQESYVEREKLTKLLDLCKRVLADTGTGTEIDEWYKEDLKSTVDQLTGIMNNERLKNFSFYYCASW